MVPVSLVSAAPATSAPRAPSSSLEGTARSRRTDGIVADLRLVQPQSSDSRGLTVTLIETNAGVARSMAGRYRNRGIELDDLEQVALLGLTKAAQRFDPGAGHDFLSYAVPTIRGELRRHFRDSGWMVRPPRRVQDLQSRISRAQDELEARLGHSPRPTEVAVHLGVGLEDVVEALTADGCFTPTSLDGPVGDGSASLGDLLGFDDRAVVAAEARIVLEPVRAQALRAGPPDPPPPLRRGAHAAGDRRGDRAHAGTGVPRAHPHPRRPPGRPDRTQPGRLIAELPLNAGLLLYPPLARGWVQPLTRRYSAFG